MGLFSFVGKAIGKVAKTALSTVTHGVSDKVLTAAKSLGIRNPVKKKALGKLTTSKDQAMLAKYSQYAPPTPKTVSTTLYTITDTTPPKRGSIGTRKKASRKVKKSLSAIRATPKRKRRDVPSSGTRKPPKGGLDLKTMAKQWAAAGKPGKWIDWVKSPGNQIRKG